MKLLFPQVQLTILPGFRIEPGCGDHPSILFGAVVNAGFRGVAFADANVRRATRFPGGDQWIRQGAETTNFDSAFDLCQLILFEFSFVQVDEAKRFHMR